MPSSYFDIAFYTVACDPVKVNNLSLHSSDHTNTRRLSLLALHGGGSTESIVGSIKSSSQSPVSVTMRPHSPPWATLPLDFGFPFSGWRSGAGWIRPTRESSSDDSDIQCPRLPSIFHPDALSHWVQTKPLHSSWRDAPGSLYLLMENGNWGNILCPPDALSHGCPLCLLSLVIFNIHFGSELSPFVYYRWNLFKSEPS